MRTIVAGEKQRVADWVAAQMGCSKWHSDFEAIGVAGESGKLLGGVVIDGYVVKSRCSLHGAGVGRMWLTRTFIKEVFNYIFKQLGCNVIVNPVSSANADSLRFTKHLGFTEIARVEGGCSDGDLVIFKMLKADCRWLESDK